MRKIILSTLIYLSFAAFLLPQAAYSGKCGGHESGSAGWAVTGDLCDLDHFTGQDKVPFDKGVIKEEYSDFVFDTSKSKVQEYGEAVHKMLTEMAKDYYLRRNTGRKVSDEEMNAWLRAVYTTANQESFWSHYRVGKDNKIKLAVSSAFYQDMGFMQIYRPVHIQKYQDGTILDLKGNILYGLDVLYPAWKNAPGKKNKYGQVCVNSETDWKNRARASYCGYNRGYGKNYSNLCKFSEADREWPQNDDNYLIKYLAQDWKRFENKENLSDEVKIQDEKTSPAEFIDMYWNRPGNSVINNSDETELSEVDLLADLFEIPAAETPANVVAPISDEEILADLFKEDLNEISSEESLLMDLLVETLNELNGVETEKEENLPDVNDLLADEVTP
jgi:hypothetical protein